MNRFAGILMAGTIALASQTVMAQPFPLSSAVTYQGQLKTGGSAYNGTADFVFRLFNASAGGALVGGPIAHNGVVIVDGTFTVSLDFGAAAYNGEERWLQIETHTPGNGGVPPFTTLTPRQRLAAAPYALRALSAVISGVQPNAVTFTNGGNGFVGSSLSIDGSTLHVDSTNNRVGIGTTTPSSLLQIREANGGIPLARIHNDTDAASSLSLDTGFRQWRVGQNQPPDGGQLDQFFVYDADAGATRLSIDIGGNVGIGTNSPAARLDVAGDALVRGSLSGASSLHVVSSTDDTTSMRYAAPFRIWEVGQNLPPDGGLLDQFFIYDATAGATRLSIDDIGRVGIGTNSPGTHVHVVNGNAAMNTLQSVNTAVAGINIASGVVGITAQANANAAGVKGINSHASGTGVIGAGNNSAPTTLGVGSGGAFTGVTTGLYANSTTGGTGEGLFTHQFGAIVRVNHWNGTQFKIIGAGAVSTVVRDVAEQPVTMFAPESPEVLFQDFGQGVLINGFAHIELDPTFAKNVLIDQDHPLRVFIQLEDNETCQGVVVRNKTAHGFDVVELRGGLSNTPFQYQITCSRADETLPSGRLSKYADLRFPPAPQDVEPQVGSAELSVGQVQAQVPPRAQPNADQ